MSEGVDQWEKVSICLDSDDDQADVYRCRAWCPVCHGYHVKLALHTLNKDREYSDHGDCCGRRLGGGDNARMGS